MQDMTKV